MNRIVLIRLIGLTWAISLIAAGSSEAQQVRKQGGVQEQAVTPATEYRPDRVRMLMLAIHGYTRAELEAASTNADEVLMSLAADGNEQMHVRRQATKGLRHYPTPEVLSFIETKSVAAPEGLKRLYLSSAGAFAQAFPDRVTALAETNLSDSNVNVRHSALKLSTQLQQTPRVRTILQNRLSAEPDAKLRAAIQKRLATSG